MKKYYKYICFYKFWNVKLFNFGKEWQINFWQNEKNSGEGLKLAKT